MWIVYYFRSSGGRVSTSCLSVRVIDNYDFNIYLFSLRRDQICTNLHYYSDQKMKQYFKNYQSLYFMLCVYAHHCLIYMFFILSSVWILSCFLFLCYRNSTNWIYTSMQRTCTYIVCLIPWSCNICVMIV